MDLDKARQLAADLVTALTPDPPPSTPNELDSAILNAKDGDTIYLHPNLTYTSRLILQKSLTLSGIAPLGGRIATFVDGINIIAPNVTISTTIVQGLHPNDTIISILGDNCTIDNNLIRGTPEQGARRGILADAANFIITRNHIDYCARPQAEGDTQCILCTDRSSGLISRNELYGGSETIMIGGDDPSSDENIPHDIEISDNFISSREEWMRGDWGVKSRLEIKNGRRITVKGNTISMCWGGHGQDGYLVSVTVRSQYGRVQSVIEDVTIENNILAGGAAVLNILGRDYNHPSGTLTRFKFVNNRATDIDPRKWEVMKGAAHTGSDKCFLIGDGPDHVTIDGNTVEGVNIGSGFYLNGKPKATELTITNNSIPKCKYGLLWGNAVGAKAWDAFVESGLYEGNTEV